MHQRIGLVRQEIGRVSKQRIVADETGELGQKMAIHQLTTLSIEI